jgi:hypothetical protein
MIEELTDVISFRTTEIREDYTPKHALPCTRCKIEKSSISLGESTTTGDTDVFHESIIENLGQMLSIQ